MALPFIGIGAILGIIVGTFLSILFDEWLRGLLGWGDEEEDGVYLDLDNVSCPNCGGDITSDRHTFHPVEMTDTGLGIPVICTGNIHDFELSVKMEV